ncbi:hypothetical protein H5410_044747 [Solanum commersonii]|uniref:Uncharacterized protein n=1 Tax=Solanum commersonii TaxID=4109 RepID=A0A9J5X7N4_SOLCO|nr:hypothetical protein H5410_044747 [Solanum commersonii]
MALGLLVGIGKAFRKKSTASLDILTAKKGPRNYYKGKNCKPTGFHTREMDHKRAAWILCPTRLNGKNWWKKGTRGMNGKIEKLDEERTFSFGCEQLVRLHLWDIIGYVVYVVVVDVFLY